MANPVLNQRTLQQQTAWAPTAVAPDVAAQAKAASKSTGVMTIGGTIVKTAGLMALVLTFAVLTWMLSPNAELAPDGTIQMSISPLVMLSTLVGFGLVVFMYFKPEYARIVAPLYAVVEGVVVGGVSKYYEAFYDGIVLQAVGATLAVFLAVLALYSSRIIRVTQRLRSIIVSMTVGLMIFYGLALLLRLFGLNISFLSQPSLLGIGFSVFAAGLAAANLLLDFDIIERGAARRFSKEFEWYAAFGLLVTIVWLYLEMLRLLRKLASR